MSLQTVFFFQKFDFRPQNGTSASFPSISGSVRGTSASFPGIWGKVDQNSSWFIHQDESWSILPQMLGNEALVVSWKAQMLENEALVAHGRSVIQGESGSNPRKQSTGCFLERPKLENKALSLSLAAHGSRRTWSVRRSGPPGGLGGWVAREMAGKTPLGIIYSLNHIKNGHFSFKI